jgi:hypothetical protein
MKVRDKLSIIIGTLGLLSGCASEYLGKDCSMGANGIESYRGRSVVCESLVNSGDKFGRAEAQEREKRSLLGPIG